MKPFSSPSVSVNGEAIRRIREEGRLTQLYVAKVVGVTTDTVSRWENNRYPTIRRENALRLAEALEVDLAQILKLEDPAPGDIVLPDLPPTRAQGGRYLFGGLILLVLIGTYGAFLRKVPVAEDLLSGQRYVPNFTAPGSRVPIRLEIISKKKLKGLIVREEFPAGWNLLEADPPPSSVDNLNGSVRWIIRNPLLHKRITYILQAPVDIPLESEINLAGEVVANPDGRRFSTRIPSIKKLKIAQLHWADTNGNSKIDDLEILEVSDMVDASENIHYNWELMEKMWDAGHYRYDEKERIFLPHKLDLPSAHK